MNFSDASLDFEVGVRNKRTSRAVESRSRKANRTPAVRVVFLARAGRVLKNKKPSRIPGKIVSERLETTTELLKPETNPDLWYELQGDSDSDWVTVCGSYPNDDSEFDRDEELLDLMWEEQLGRHLERGERFSEERPAFYDSDSSYELGPDDESSSSRDDPSSDDEDCWIELQPSDCGYAQKRYEYVIDSRWW